jgi:hypothetical protein
MTPQIHPDVEEIRDSPTSGESVSLALVVDQGSVSGVQQAVRDLSGTVEEVLPSGVLTITLSEDKVDELCEVEGDRSVSPDGDLRILT